MNPINSGPIREPAISAQDGSANILAVLLALLRESTASVAHRANLVQSMLQGVDNMVAAGDLLAGIEPVAAGEPFPASTVTTLNAESLNELDQWLAGNASYFGADAVRANANAQALSSLGGTPPPVEYPVFVRSTVTLTEISTDKVVGTVSEESIAWMQRSERDALEAAAGTRTSSKDGVVSLVKQQTAPSSPSDTIKSSTSIQTHFIDRGAAPRIDAAVLQDLRAQMDINPLLSRVAVENGNLFVDVGKLADALLEAEAAARASRKSHDRRIDVSREDLVVDRLIRRQLEVDGKVPAGSVRPSSSLVGKY